MVATTNYIPLEMLLGDAAQILQLRLSKSQSFHWTQPAEKTYPRNPQITNLRIECLFRMHSEQTLQTLCLASTHGHRIGLWLLFLDLWLVWPLLPIVLALFLKFTNEGSQQDHVAQTAADDAPTSKRIRHEVLQFSVAVSQSRAY